MRSKEFFKFHPQFVMVASEGQLAFGLAKHRVKLFFLSIASDVDLERANVTAALWVER